MEKTKIVVAGPRGKMGSEAVKLVENTEEYELVAVVDHKHGGQLLNELEGISKLPLPIYSDLAQCLMEVKADVLIDLTTPEVGMNHTKTALQLGVRPVVGTTGFTPDNLKELEDLCKEKELGCIIAPNFAVGCCFNDEIFSVSSEVFPGC